MIHACRPGYLVQSVDDGSFLAPGHEGDVRFVQRGLVRLGPREGESGVEWGGSSLTAKICSLSANLVYAPSRVRS